jgi:hypothetical protein
MIPFIFYIILTELSFILKLILIKNIKRKIYFIKNLKKAKFLNL